MGREFNTDKQRLGKRNWGSEVYPFERRGKKGNNLRTAEPVR